MIEIEHLDPSGAAVRCPAADVSTSDLLAAPSIRKPPNYRGRRNRVGWVWLATTGASVVFESLLEESVMLFLDAQPDVSSIRSQPFRAWSGRNSHVPDIMFELTDGSTGLVAVKPQSFQGTERNRRGFDLCNAAADAIGSSFTVQGELGEAVAHNVAVLRAYRRPLPPDDPVPAAVVDVAQRLGPMPLRTLADSAGGWAVALPVIGNLIWSGALTIDWDTPIDERSTVGLVELVDA